VPPREERALAAQLDRVLDGQERADGELAALATVLELAAAPARFEVGEDEVEQALAAALPRKTSNTVSLGRRARPALALVAVTAVAAAVALVLTRGSALHVEDPALAALGGPTSILRVIERVEPTKPGTFPVSVRVGWIDSGGQRIRWDDYVRGRRIAETLLERGRVTRYLLTQNVVIVGASCRAFASGCAELVDPIELYRRALQRGAERTRRATLGMRRVFVLSLPVQTLADAVRIEQRVTIDARTYLPLQIEWVEERRGAEPRSFARIVVKRVREVPPEAANQAFQITAPGVRVVQRVAAGKGLKRLGQRRLALPEARRVRPALRWVGPDHLGRPLTAIDEIRWNAGKAYRLRYGALLTIWNYGNLVPPEIAANRYVPAKVIALPDGRVARFYEAIDGRLVLELEGPARSVALIAPQFGKEDLFQTLQLLQPLR
jgi:hypothetical protein